MNNIGSGNSDYVPKRPPLDMFRAGDENMRRAVVEKYLARLIGGVHSDSTQLMFLHLEANGCILGEGAFMLAAVVPDRFSPADCAIVSMDELYENLRKSVHAMLSTHCINYLCEISGAIAAVMCFPHARSVDEVEDGEILQSLCAEQFGELADRYEVEYNVKLRSYISSLFFGSGRMPEVYGELLAMWRYDVDFLRPLRDRPVMIAPAPDKQRNVDFEMLSRLSENVGDQLKARGAAAGNLYMESLRQLVLTWPHTREHLRIRLTLMANALSDRTGGRGVLDNTEMEKFLGSLYRSEDWAELHNIWSEGLSLFTGPAERSGPLGEAPVREICEYIESNISSPWLSVNAVAEEFGVSPALLSQRFKRSLGCGPLEYMRRARVELAISLLEHTDLSISEVSVSAGYGSLVTMQRDFNRFAGCPPSVMRQKIALDAQLRRVDSSGGDSKSLDFSRSIGYTK